MTQLIKKSRRKPNMDDGSVVYLIKMTLKIIS